MELKKLHFCIVLGAVIQTILAVAPGCTSTLTSSHPTPVVASGWSVQLVATGLARPRGILFDSNGALLVVQQGVGIVHLALNSSENFCVEVSKITNLVNSSAVRPNNWSTMMHVAANGITAESWYRTVQ